jgi:hypothetical protein
MAESAVPCDIPHVGDVLIVFRRPASTTGGRRHAATPDRDASLTDDGGRGRGAKPAGGSDRSSDEVRLLRVRRRVVSPRT